MYAIIAVGLTLIFGIGRVVHFAQGEFLMIGMYAVFLLSRHAGLHPAMSVRDNVLMGAYHPAAREGMRQRFDEVLDLFPRVRKRLDQFGVSVAGGEQQMVALARGLILIERKAFHALRIARRAYAMENGRIVKANSGAGLLADPDIKSTYLGI